MDQIGQINGVLGVALTLIGIFRSARSAWKAAHPGETDPFTPDAELIALLKLDADAFVARVDEMIARYRMA